MNTDARHTKIEAGKRKPTAAQRKVLEAMRDDDGAVVVWRIGERPYLKRSNGSVSNMMRKTVLPMINERWVTNGGTIGASWYEITPLGRSILEEKK